MDNDTLWVWESDDGHVFMYSRERERCVVLNARNPIGKVRKYVAETAKKGQGRTE